MATTTFPPAPLETPDKGEYAGPALAVPHANHILRRRWVWLAGAVLLLYAASVSSKWVIYPDSSIYLLVGRSLAEGNGCSVFGHPQGKYPPGFSLYLAALYRLGLGDMLTLNCLMIVMALATLLFSYRLLRELTTPSLALVLTLTLAVLHEMYRLSVAQLSDIPFMLLVTAGLWCLIGGARRGGGSLEVGALLLLGSCWVRILGIPLALAAAVGLVLQAPNLARRRVWFSAAVLVAGAVAIGVWFYVRDRALQAGPTPPPTYASTITKISDRTLTARLVQPLWNVYEGGPNLARLFTGQRLPEWLALILVWLPVTVGAYVLAARRHYLAVGTAAGYLTAIFLLQPPLARYYLPVAPVLLLCLAEGIHRLVSRLGKSPLLASNVVLGTILVLLAVNLPKDLRQVYRQHDPRIQSCALYQDMVRVADYLRDHAHDGSRFVMGKHALIVAYLSGIDCLHIEPHCAKQPIQERAIHALLRDEGVSHVVVRKAPWPARTFHATVRNGIVDWSDYQLVYECANFQIFSRVADEVPINERWSIERQEPHRSRPARV